METNVIAKKKEKSHLDRAKRRKEIANFVRRKEGSIPDAARVFKVTIQTVRSACITYGVDADQEPTNVPQEKTYKVISYLLHVHCTCRQAAEHFGISRARIQAIRDLMKKAGIPIGIGAYLNNQIPKSKRSVA